MCNSKIIRCSHIISHFPTGRLSMPTNLKKLDRTLFGFKTFKLLRTPFLVVLSSSLAASLCFRTVPSTVSLARRYSSTSGPLRSSTNVTPRRSYRTVTAMPRVVERDGDTITVTPEDGKHSATMILLHGLGDSCDGFADVAEMLNSAMPHLKIILPTAHSIPVTLNGGMRMPAWYDIVGLTDRASESCEGILGSVARVTALLDKEAELGLPYHRMMLAGFSQGGALSIYTGYQLPIDKKLAGLLVMSGYLPGASSFKLTPGLEDLPVLHCHGDSDPVVQHDWAVKTRDHVSTVCGAQRYSLKSYRRVVHTVNEDILRDASAHIASVLPHHEQFVVRAIVKAPSEMSVKELKEAIRKHGLSQRAVGFSEKREFVELLETHLSGK